MSIEVGYQVIPCPSYVNYMVATEFHLAGFFANPMVGILVLNGSESDGWDDISWEQNTQRNIPVEKV